MSLTLNRIIGYKRFFCKVVHHIINGPLCVCLATEACLTRFNKIAIQGTPEMAVDKEARAYRESTHIVILSIPCLYTKCYLP